MSVRKIYILTLNRDQLRKMQLQGLRLGIEPATLDLQTNTGPTESRVQFAAGGFGVAFFATGPGWVLKCKSF